MSYQTESLPCLNAIGPWWNEHDRMLLFCHLLSIFPFEPSYLANLPVTSHMEDPCTINEKNIDKEFQIFCKTNKKCNCSKIRRLNLSFGKFNTRLCYLCPYSTTYRNEAMDDEHRMLYYMLQSTSHSLSFFLDEEKKKVEEVFHSFFPVYAGNVLVDAFPFSLVAKEFVQLPAVTYSDDPDTFRSELLSRLYQDMDSRINYQRNKDLYRNYDPNYQKTAYSCVASIFSTVEKIRPEISASNLFIVNRLFRILASSGQKKYVPRKPDMYQMGEKPLTPSPLFDVVTNPLEHLEDSYFQTLPSLDDAPRLQQPDLRTIKQEAKIPKDAEKVSPIRKQESGNIPKAQDKVPVLYPDFYPLESADWFYQLENNNIADQTAFLALMSESSYYCMEPVICNDVNGVLIMNSDQDFIFYSIELYGPRIMRFIVNTGRPVFTCSTYSLDRYLHRNKVYGLISYDYAVLKTLLEPEQTFSLHNLFPSDVFVDIMPMYQSSYNLAKEQLNEEQISLLEQYQHFVPLLSSTGMHAPFFRHRKNFCQTTCFCFKNMYHPGLAPIRSGTYLCLNTAPKDITPSVIDLKKLYMDICIDLNRFVSFCEGKIYLLSLSKSGLLLFATGSDQEVQKAQLYLKSSVRRIYQKKTISDIKICFETHYTEYQL